MPILHQPAAAAAAATGGRRPLPTDPRVWAAGAAGLVAVAAAVLALLLDGGAAAAGAVAGLLLPLSAAATTVAIGLALWAAAMAEPARRGHALLADAFDATQAAYLISAPDGAVLGINQAARGLLDGRRVRDLADVEAFLAPDAEALTRFQRLRRNAERGAPFSGEIRRARADGQACWWLISAEPLERRGLLLWRITDITTQREMEALLREEQVKLVDFMDHAPVGFYSVDGDGRFVFVNATLARWLGVEAAALVREDHRLHQFLLAPPAGAPAYALTEEDGGPGSVDVLMVGRDGRHIHASVAQTVVRGEEPGQVWTRSVVRDLTHERQMREALRVSEDRIKRFFEDAPIGIAILDPQFRLIEWNRAFQDLVGLDHFGLAGRPLADFVPEASRGAMLERLAAVTRGQESGEPLEVRLKGEPELVVSLFAKCLGGGAGTGGLILQFIDQTERKNLEAQFVQSQKMQAVGQLAGGIAHDFNNLLTAMIGFGDLLLMRHKPGDPSFGDIMQIKQNANRAANLVRQLLAFSRQQTLQPKLLNITDALAELSNLLRRLIGENIELKMIHGRDLGMVMVDQGQLEQVIINMAVNARDAMVGGGRLTIRTENRRIAAPERRRAEELPAGDYVLIAIGDTGVGIPPENLDRIFDPFFSTKEVGSGTGLGLSTVYGIVRQTGGYVFVDSAPGQGALFEIFLPRHEPIVRSDRVGAISAEQGTRDLTGAGRILLVEDEDAVRVFGARALRNKGYDVLEADSGEKALDLLSGEDGQICEIDLLISDVIMPNMDGPTLIRRVRELRPEIKVIFISGYAEDKFRERLGDGESIHFLPKPFSLKQLAAKVKDVLREAA